MAGSLCGRALSVSLCPHGGRAMVQRWEEKTTQATGAGVVCVDCFPYRARPRTYKGKQATGPK